MLTPSEVAMTLRLSLGAVYGLIRDGVLPATHIGRRIRIPEKVLTNFIEAGGRGWPGGWRKARRATGQYPPSPEAA